MDRQREGESINIPLRSNRYYYINGVWYFHGREGKKHGPFLSKKEMEAALQDFIQSQQNN